MPEYKLISADSHVMEPRDLWEQRIDQKFRDRAPRIAALDESGDYMVIEYVTTNGLQNPFTFRA